MSNKKITITREQAKAIEDFKKHEMNLESFAKWRSGFTHEYKPIKDLSIDEMARALYVGYEVKPEFKEWDWVVYLTPSLEERVGMITDVFYEEEKFVINNYSYTRQKDHILRHANAIEVKEAEKAEWHNRGRDVWELKTGDILADRFGSIIEIQSCHNGEVVYTFGEYKLTDKMENIKEEFYIAFFVEDRQLPIL